MCEFEILHCKLVYFLNMKPQRHICEKVFKIPVGTDFCASFITLLVNLRPFQKCMGNLYRYKCFKLELRILENEPGASGSHMGTGLVIRLGQKDDFIINLFTV